MHIQLLHQIKIEIKIERGHDENEIIILVQERFLTPYTLCFYVELFFFYKSKIIWKLPRPLNPQKFQVNTYATLLKRLFIILIAI